MYVPHPELEDLIARTLGGGWTVSGFDMKPSSTDGRVIITSELSTEVPEGGFSELAAALEAKQAGTQNFDPAEEELG